MTTTSQLLNGFHHVYAAGAPGGRTLLLLHGTGGTEHDLVSLAGKLDPAANILSPRGKVLERGMPRFFRRLAEGVFDEKDVIARANELADFVTAASRQYGFPAERVTAVGFSNGANIALATLLLRPEALAGVAAWRPMLPIAPDPLPDLNGRRVLLAHGRVDPLTDGEAQAHLTALLESTQAAVESRYLPTGHTLTQVDIELTHAWLNRG